MRNIITLLITILLIVCLVIFIYFYSIKVEKTEELKTSLENWPMFKHDIQRTGNLFSKVNVTDIYYDPTSPVISIRAERPSIITVGSNELGKNIILDKNDTLDPSPIFVDLDLDGKDEIITFYKNTAFDNTTEHRAFKDFVMEVKYKENPNELEKQAFGEVPFVISWKFILEKEMHTSFAASDLNKDGYPEIAFGSDDNNLYVLDKNGNLVFKFETKGKVRSTPAIADIDFDGNQEIVFGSDDGNLYALSNGKLMWSFKASDKIESSPTIFSNNYSYFISFGSDDNNLYVLDDSGRLACKYETGGHVRSSPLVYEDKMTFGSDDGNIYILDIHCNLLKKYKTNGAVRSSSTVTKDYFVVGSEDGNLYFFNESQIENISLSAPIYSTPVSIEDKILISTFNGKTYLLNSTYKKIISDINSTKNFSCTPAIGDMKFSYYSCFFIHYTNNTQRPGFFIR